MILHVTGEHPFNYLKSYMMHCIKAGSISLANKEKNGRGVGQVVSVLAFFSDDPSSNPA